MSSEAKSLRLLLVEDDSLVRRLTLRTVAKLTDQVQVAENGIEALALLQEHEFDVVVTDLKMPGASGLQVARRARERLPAARLVIITGLATAEDEVVARQLRATILRKPFARKQFFDAIQNSSI